MGATRKSNEMNQKIAHTLLHELALQTTAIETWVAVWFNHTCALTIICGISNWILNTNKPIALPISNDVTTDPAHSNSNSLSFCLCLAVSVSRWNDGATKTLKIDTQLKKSLKQIRIHVANWLNECYILDGWWVCTLDTCVHLCVIVRAVRNGSRM